MTPLLAAFLLLASGPSRAEGRRQLPAEGSAAPAANLSDEEVEARVKTYLGSIDTPIPPARWKALGARGAALLEPLIRDGEQFPTRRAKAVDGLAAIAPAGAQVLLLTLAAGEKEPLVVRLSALRGLGQVVPARKLQAVLAPLLTGGNEHAIRAGAAEVLVAQGLGCDAALAQMARETEEVRGAYHRAQKGCAELKAKAGQKAPKAKEE